MIIIIPHRFTKGGYRNCPCPSFCPSFIYLFFPTIAKVNGSCNNIIHYIYVVVINNVWNYKIRVTFYHSKRLVLVMYMDSVPNISKSNCSILVPFIIIFIISFCFFLVSKCARRPPYCGSKCPRLANKSLQTAA